MNIFSRRNLKKHGNIEGLDLISIGRVIQNLINDLFKHRYTIKNFQVYLKNLIILKY